MTPAEKFKQQHTCTFEPDERMEALRQRMIQYYKDIEPCSNQLAAHYRKDFKHWCRVSGYTSKEINQVKRSIPPSDEEAAEYLKYKRIE